MQIRLSSRTFRSSLFQRLGKVQTGFSLVEVVIALGIVSFSLVGILSMFPVALATAAESKSETRVTLIAENIFSDLRFSSPTNAAVVLKAPVDASSFLDPNYVAHSPLANFTSRYVAYDQEGRPIQGISSNDFKGPLTSVQFAAFAASISTNATPLPGLARVDVTVISPPQAGSASRTRKSYLFTTYLSTQ